MTTVQDITSSMTSSEKRATWSLAGIYALRMLGLFMILPVLSLFAEQLEGSTPCADRSGYEYLRVASGSAANPFRPVIGSLWPQKNHYYRLGVVFYRQRDCGAVNDHLRGFGGQGFSGRRCGFGRYHGIGG